MKHVLVTGGAGYIGSHACKLLARRGYIPVTFDSLGTGVGFSVAEVIRHCRAGTGRKVPHVFGPRRAGDAASLDSGSKRAAEELGWTAERSSLKLMIEDAWRWYQTGGYSE